MKIATIALSALGLAGSTAGQNGNDALIYNNRTAIHISVPLTPSPMRSNIFIKPTTSIECWRNGYPCGQGGGQRSQRLVAEFVEPTPAIAARVPPPEFFSTRTDVKVPGQADIPGKTGRIPIDTHLPVLEPTAEASMGILPIPVSLGGNQHTYGAPQDVVHSDAIFSALPITTSTSTVGTSTPYNPHSTWPSHWRGATSEIAAAPLQTIRCNGTRGVPSTPVSKPKPNTSSHFAIPPDPSLPITDTYTEPTISSTSTAQLTPLPITTVSEIIQDPLMTPAPDANTTSSMVVPDGTKVRYIYCGSDWCTPIEMSGLSSCFGTPMPRAGVTVAPVTVTINCDLYNCHPGMVTVYTITPTPFTSSVVPVTSDLVISPEGTPVGAVNKPFVPIDWWRGPDEPNVPETPKDLDSHSSLAPISSVATGSPCYRHYCPSDHSTEVPPTATVTTSKPAQPVDSASLHFPSRPPSFSTFTA